ncbi:MAG: hypothetical protein A3F17_04810 [Gammaproteobacteria bacterium RIFCSPHIGHO2_12_FULL_41_15]|nr:MAG: hypothetical protein A3F17_04810 [Gammaproteobacteria bacterium RIFCSPHIGHO2_12_FULL_41_15]
MRKTLSIIFGILSAFVVISLIEMINHILYPMPANLNPNEMQAIQEWIKTLPALAYLIVLLAYFMGSVVGGAIARLIHRNSMATAITVGCVMFLAGVANFLMIRAPVWFAVICLLTYVPSACFGAWIVGALSTKKPKHIVRDFA